jgi:small-conductance mechanosensitive channel
VDPTETTWPQSLFDLPIYGGTPRDWLIALAISIGLGVVVYLLRPALIARLRRNTSESTRSIQTAVIAALTATRLWLVSVFAASIGSHYLELPEAHQKVLSTVTALAFFLQAGFWLSSLLRFWLQRSEDRARQANPGAATSLAAMGFVAKIALWSIIVLLALDNMGVNITALVAGLGVGGVAVALAVQNILGDLFASLSIVIDKPFVIGDFIIVDDFLGTVQHVGLKTTRVRSLSGEQLVFSNSDLLKSRLRNYKQMVERRIVFGFGVVYGTRPEQLEEIGRIVKRLIESESQARFDRAHFFKFGESSLDFEAVYIVLGGDYNLYMDIQQRINLGLMRELEKMGVDFAFPTRTVMLGTPVKVERVTMPSESSEVANQVAT